MMYVRGSDPSFERCMPFILKEEGGDSNTPHDSGGKTHKGIIQREYDAFRDERGLPQQSVFHASDDEVYTIYYYGTKQDRYWLPRCPHLNPGVDLVYFNIAVNAGHGEAEKILLRSIGGTDAQTVDRMCNNLATFYRGLSNFRYFHKNWLGRTERCRALAKSMVGKPKERPVTTTPTPGAAANVAPSFHINFNEIETGLTTIAKFLPIISAVFPPAQVILPFVPIIEGILNMAAELQNLPVGSDHTTVANVVASHLQAMGQNVQAQAAKLNPDPQMGGR